MNKLDPRPDFQGQLYSWDYLNNILQMNFDRPGNNSVTIDVRNYSIPKDEIVFEAEKQGYKVIGQGEYYLRFE